MSAWDGWAGAFASSAIGSAVGLGVALFVMYRTRKADREGQETLLADFEQLSRRNAASEEMARFARSVAELSTPGFNPFNTLRVARELQIANMSIFRASQLVGAEGNEYFVLMATATHNLAKRAVRLKNPAWMLRASLRNAIAIRGLQIAIEGMTWIEKPERRVAILENMRRFAAIEDSRTLIREVRASEAVKSLK